MVGVGQLPLGERKCTSVVSSHIGVSTQQGGGHLKFPSQALVVLRGVPSDGASNGGVSPPLMVAGKGMVLDGGSQDFDDVAKV